MAAPQLLLRRSLKLSHPWRQWLKYSSISRTLSTPLLPASSANNSLTVSPCAGLHTTHFARVKTTQENYVWLTQTTFAGHSKWQNIRHIKGAKDAQKAATSSRYVREINNAIREGNGLDPKFNVQLARVIERAENDDVPKQTIQNAIKRFKEGKPRVTHYYDMKGPGNCSLIIEAFTEHVHKTKNDLVALTKKFGGRMTDSKQFAFDKKRVILISAEGRSFEQAEELAIEAGAEEVEELTENGEKFHKLICSDEEVFLVKKMIELKNIEILSFETEYVPVNLTVISEDAQDLLMKLLDKVETLDEVVRIFDNVQVQE